MSEEDDIEVRAKAVGWNPGGEKSAEEFLDERNDNNKMLRTDIEKLESQLLKANNVVEQMAAAWNHESKKAFKEGYAAAIKSKRSEIRKAAEDGDIEKLDALEKEHDQLVEASKKDPDPIIDLEKPADNAAERLKGEIVEHIQANPELFSTVAQKNAWVEQMRYAVESLGKKPAEAMKSADKYVVEQFGLQKNIGGPDAGGKPSGRGDGQFKRLSDLPEEGRKTFKEIQARLKSKGVEYTEDQYLEALNNG